MFIYELSIIDNENNKYKKYYMEYNNVTRNSYITYLKRVVKENYLLENIKYFAKDYIEKGINPWDDEFSFANEKINVYGTIFQKYFYEYTFDFNNLNYKLYYTADDRKSREEFIHEVISFLRYSNNYSLIENLNKYLKGFRSIDNEILKINRLNITQLKDY